MGESLTIERPGGDGLGLMDQVGELAGVRAEGHAAGVDVGAGDVQLIGCDACGLVEALNDRDVLGDLVAEDVDDDVGAGIAGEGRQLAADKLLDAHILQADGVQHSGGGLDDARRGMAGDGVERDALGDEAADALESDDVFKFDAVAKGAAGGDDRTGQIEAGKRHIHLRFHARQSSFLTVMSSQFSVASPSSSRSKPLVHDTRWHEEGA